MSTVQVEDRVKKKLFSFAAKLQAESGRKVSLSEAIDRLIDLQQGSGDNKNYDVDNSKLLSLFGIIRGKGESKIAQKTLQELRQGEEKAIEEKYSRATRKSRS